MKDIGLRDWFAGMALQGLIARNTPNVEINGHTFSLDNAAFLIADSMMETRKND